MAKSDATRVLSETIDQFLKGFWSRNPVNATADGIHDHDSYLGEFESSAIQDRIAWFKSQLRSFQSIDSRALSDDDVLDLRLAIAMLHSNLMYAEGLRIYESNPIIYPELCVYACYLPCVRDYAPIGERLDSVVKRLELIPRVLVQAVENLKNPPRIWVELACETCQGAMSFVGDALPSLFEQVPSLRSDFREASTRALSALEGYGRFLTESLRARSSGDYSIGREKFDFLLREVHMLELDSDSLLHFGENWIRRTEEALSLLADRISPGKSWREVIEQSKTEHPQPSELLDFYRDRIESAKRFTIENGLVTLGANEELSVVPTPDFERAFLPYAAYLPAAPFEKEQKGFFFVTTIPDGAAEETASQYLKGHNKYKATVTALHEAYPGHHTQIVISNGHRSKMRRLFRSNLFLEGWALYCEEMMYEQGFYPDETTRLFQLKDTLWRACRVVLDVKLHLGLIEYDEACNFLVEKAGLERLNAVREINRYTMSPTQPMSYLVGREEIMRLRDTLRSMMPAPFDLARFHDWLLSHGSIPVSLISVESFFS